MTNQELYERFIKYKSEKKITFQELADKLETSTGNICDRVTALKNGKSVRTKFLIDIENAIGESIFFKE